MSSLERLVSRGGLAVNRERWAILLRAAGEARGDPRALRLLLQLTERYGESVQTEADREVTGAEDLAILRRYLPDFDNPSPIGIAPEKHGDAEA